MCRFKRVQSILLVLVMLLSLFSGSGLTAWADQGTVYTGQTAQGEYTISTGAQLAKLASVVNEGATYEGSTFTLEKDIDLSVTDNSGDLNWVGGTEWTPIAQFMYPILNEDKNGGTPTGFRFMGTFDGKGHYIKNISIQKMGGMEYEGYSLFGAIGEKSVVKNLGVTGNVASYRCSGGIAGYNYGTISMCFNEANINANGGGGTRGTGGIVGHNEGTVEYSINSGMVHNANRRAGGIVGFNYGSSAKISYCYNVGAVTSASQGYAGAIAATNGQDSNTAGTIENCYALAGSAEANIGLDKSINANLVENFNTKGFILDDSGKETTDTLKSKLSSTGKFIDPATGFYPVLSWQAGYQLVSCNVTIAPAEGGTFKAKVNDTEITGNASVVAGTKIELEASQANSGYMFMGFTAKADGKTTNLGGSAKEPPYKMTYTVTSDVTLGAGYNSTDGQALTISSQAGRFGKKTVTQTKTWADILGMKENKSDGYGYMYTHGTDGWTIVSATEYVPLTTLFGSEVKPNDSDYIIASSSDGSSPGVIPTWGLLKQDLYFFPEATESITNGSSENKSKVPAAVAMSVSSSMKVVTNSALNTADKVRVAAANNAYNSGSLRFVYGSTEEDYKNLTEGSTIQGNRIWKGTTDISVAKAPARYEGDIIAAPLGDAISKPYRTYSAALDKDKQTVTIAATGLVSHKNKENQEGKWVGIAIPVPEDQDYNKIQIGTNNTELKSANKTNADFTVSGSGVTADTKYVSYYWDYAAKDNGTGKAVEYIQFSLDGGTTVHEIKVDTSSITGADVNFCGIPLTLEDMKKYPTTAVYSMVGKSGITKYTVTGITISDILNNYALDVKPAALQFKGPSDSSDVVYNSTSSGVTGHDWSQTMLIWSQLDGTTEKISSGLKSAVNGGTGKMWWSGVNSVDKVSDAALTIKSENGVFADRFMSLSQLKEQEKTESSWVKKTSKLTTYDSVSGIKINDLLSSYVPYSDKVGSITFYDKYPSGKSNIFQKTTYSGITAGLLNDFDNGMVTWSNNVTGNTEENVLYSALNGGTGKHWWSNINTVSVAMSNVVTFHVTPSNANITVKDSKDNIVAPTSGKTYLLSDGAYTYGATASGYTDKSSSFTVSGENQTIAVELTSKGGSDSGGGTGTDPTSSTYEISDYSSSNGSVKADKSSAKAGDTITLTVAPASGYVLTNLSLSNGTIKEKVTSAKTTYTFVMPSSKVTVTASFDKAALTIYTQVGESGKEEVAAVFSRAQLEDMAKTVTNPSDGYIYYKGTEWMAVVPKKYVTLDSLLADAGLSFGSGDSIKAFASGDSFYDTVSYKNLQSYQYYFDPNNNGAKKAVPYVIALEHVSGTLSGSSPSKILSSGSMTTTLRNCYGCSEEQYKEKTAMGRRMVSSMNSLTIIKSATVNSNTKDGTSPSVIKDESATAAVEAKVNVTGNKATTTVSEKDIKDSISSAASGGKKIQVKINAISKETVNTTEVTVPNGAISEMSKNTQVNEFKIITNMGTISLDTASLNGIAAQQSGSSVSFSIGVADTSSVTDAQKTLAGSNPIYSLSVSAGSQKISTFKGSVTVTLPYKLAANEDPKKTVVYYLSSEGKVEKFEGAYDAATGTVSFKTGHFSVYMPVNEATAGFTDVKLTNWFYNAANYAVKKGMMNGTTQTTFEPDTKTTRAMFVTILWRMEGKAKPSLSKSPFADVTDKNAWYYDAVLWASEKGIVKGLTDDRFGASQTLSRQEMVTILHRYAQTFHSKLTATGTMDTSKFSDWNSIPGWAKESMQWAYVNKLITGNTETTLLPNGNATRAQLAMILMRYQ